MPRIVANDLAQLVTLTGDRTADGFIATATLIVDEELEGKGLSTDRLKQIELYLAAHFATLAEERGGLSAIIAGESEERYQARSQEDRGFQLTRYGQQALLLDTTGTLGTSYAANPLKAEFRIV